MLPYLRAIVHLAVSSARIAPTKRVTLGVEEDPDHVSAPSDLLVELFLWIGRADLRPVLGRERADGQDIVGRIEQVERHVVESGHRRLIDHVCQRGPGGRVTGESHF